MKNGMKDNGIIIIGSGYIKNDVEGKVNVEG